MFSLLNRNMFSYVCLLMSKQTRPGEKQAARWQVDSVKTEQATACFVDRQRLLQVHNRINYSIHVLNDEFNVFGIMGIVSYQNNGVKYFPFREDQNQPREQRFMNIQEKYFFIKERDISIRGFGM